MRILATWIVVLFRVLQAFVELIPALSGVTGPGVGRFRFWMTIASLCCALWGLLYLLRAKDKNVHEKIGLTLNCLWLGYIVIMLFGVSGMLP